VDPSSPGRGVSLVEIAASYRYPEIEPSPARVKLRRMNRPARMIAALRALGLCWLAAIAAVFVPVLHFVLVPSLLLGGPLAFLWKLGEQVTLLSADGTCPACHAPIAHRVKQRAAEHTNIRCDHCGRNIDLVLPAAELAPGGGAHPAP